LAEGGLPLPRYASELLKSGEMTGKLGAALRSGAQQMEQEIAFAREARNALIYPAVLVTSGLAATLMVFVFVVPKFASILSNPKADIPVFSLWVLQAGLWLAEHRLVTMACLAGLAVLLTLAWRSPAARLGLWNTLARLPVTAPWVAHSELARWATMLSVMLHNAVPLLEALALARNGLRASTLVHKAAQISADVRGGKTLGDSMRMYGFADGTTINLVAVGENSGALAQTTQVIGEMHRVQSQQLLKRFLVLLEPLTILAISVVLGGIMISVMLAVTSLTNVI
jgi:general secretion pathway protein F